MKVQTISLIAGTEACNARCPFCVSGMTESRELGTKIKNINIRNLQKALLLAEKMNATTVLITGKGEPTLFPQHIDTYMSEIENCNAFPLVELQTNAVLFAENGLDERLKEWHHYGMTTIIISVVDYISENNRMIYTPYKKEYIDLQQTIKKLHDLGFMVRLGVVAIKDGISNIDRFQRMLEFASNNKVKQLTIRPVTKTDFTNDVNINKWIEQNGLPDVNWQQMVDFVKQKGTLLLKLVHGAAIYDLYGQNVCMSNCLTIDPNEETLRQLIFFPDGTIAYDWVHKGAVLL